MENAVHVDPEEDLPSLVVGALPGTTFLLGQGVHRWGGLQPKAGQVFEGQPGAILSGGLVLGGFRQEGSHWVIDHKPSLVDPRGSCEGGREACRFPEDLFLDGRLLDRVDAVEQVIVGAWFFDRDFGRIHLGQDPGDALVEISSFPFAFEGGGENVRIRGLTIEKYATPAQSAAIMTGRGWVVEESEIHSNHASGIRISSGTVVRRNYIHHNGQFGLNGGGSGVRIEQNEIAANNTAHFSALWAAGGAKFVHTTDLLVEGNLVRDNGGPGLWTDGEENRGVVYRGNVVIGNAHAGIKHELGGQASIEGNEISNNGFGHPVRHRGAGILVRESSDVLIRDNRISSNADALILLHDARRSDTGAGLSNVRVEHNLMGMGTGSVGYLGGLEGDGFRTGPLIFEGNEYVVEAGEAVFLDHGRRLSFDEWAAAREPGARRLEPHE